MATSKTGGIRGVMSPAAQTYLDMLANPNFGMATDWDKVRAQKGELAKYLGTTDYDAQLQESQKLAKLQMALALAQRGESPIATIGRTLLSPIAADIAPIAGRLMQQRQAAKAAQAQEERAMKLAAFQQTQTQAAGRRDLILKLMASTKAVKPTIANLPELVQEWVMKDGKLGLDPVRQFAIRKTVDGKTTVILPGGEEPDKAIIIGSEKGHFKIVDPKETAAGKRTYTGNFVVVDANKKGVEEGTEGDQRLIQLVLGNDGKYYRMGAPDKGVYLPKTGEIVVESQYFNFSSGAVKTDAPNQTEIARNNLVQGVVDQLGLYQSKLAGPQMPITNKPNVLYWNQGEYVKGNSPY